MKRKVIKILMLMTFLIVSYTAWKKRMNISRAGTSISYPIFDQTDDIQVKEDVAYYVKGEKCRAFSRICPHLGCKVEADNTNKCFMCPCHGSKFNLDGEPIKGPATENLREYKCEVENGSVRIYFNDK